MSGYSNDLKETTQKQSSQITSEANYFQIFLDKQNFLLKDLNLHTKTLYQKYLCIQHDSYAMKMFFSFFKIPFKF